MNKFNQAKYIQEFQKEKYDRCIFNVPKGQKAVIEEHWRRKGYKSLNAYVNALIEADMKQSNDIIAVVKVASGRDLAKLRKKSRVRLVAQERK